MLDYIVYLLVISCAAVMRLLPYKLALMIGENLGVVVFYIDKRHRQRTIDNLNMVFKELKSSDEIYKIAKGVYRNIGRAAIEFLWIPKFNKKNIKRYVSYDGLDNLKAALKKEKGVLYLAFHFGSWELGPIAHALNGYPLSFIARPIDNKYIDRWVNKYRCRFGNKVIPKKQAIKGIFKALKEKEQIGILMDQNTSPKESVFVNYFNRLCSTTPILAVIALKTSAPVLPTYTLPIGKGRHKIVIGPEIKLDIKGEKEKDIIINTQILTKAIEDIVMKYPEYWFWMHRRWKTQPQEQVEEIGRVRKV